MKLNTFLAEIGTSVADIRPLTQDDIETARFDTHTVRPEWVAVRWSEQNEPDNANIKAFDCVGWIENKRLFLPFDGQSGLQLYHPESPAGDWRMALKGQSRDLPEIDLKTEMAARDEYLRFRWYESETGKYARWREAQAIIWYTQSGPAQRGVVQF